MEELLRLLDEATGAADIDVVDLVRGALSSHRVELRRLKDVFEYYDRKGTGKVCHQHTLSILSLTTPGDNDCLHEYHFCNLPHCTSFFAFHLIHCICSLFVGMCYLLCCRCVRKTWALSSKRLEYVCVDRS